MYDTPFAIVEPRLAIREVHLAEDSHRAYTAGGAQGRFPSRHSFASTVVSWAVGPGSYGAPERVRPHTPGVSWAASSDGPDATGSGGHAQSAQTQKALDVIRRGNTSLAFSSLGLETAETDSLIGPRAMNRHAMRGPLLSQSFASSHASHSKEELLKARLQAAHAAPTVSRVHLHVATSDFGNASRRGALFSTGADIGYRDRVGAPSGPSLAASMRPDWQKLAVYVPPSVSGPRARLGEEYIPELDPETGQPLYSQARLRALAEKGVRVKNFLALNARSQGVRTAAASAAEIAARNRMLESKLERAAEILAQKQSQRRRTYEAAAREKDQQFRAERRAARQAQRDAEQFAGSWLTQIVIAESLRIFRARLHLSQLARLKRFAAKRIWKFYSKWKAGQKDKIEQIRRKRRPKAKAAALMRQVTADATAAAAAAAASASGTPSGSNSPRKSTGLASSGGGGGSRGGSGPTTPRAVSSMGADGVPILPLSPLVKYSLTNSIDAYTPRTAEALRSKGGLAQLVAFRTNEEAAHTIIDFITWTRGDMFKRLKDAMLTFRRKARLIQRWWRNILLSNQWRLWVQTLQFLGFRDKTARVEMEHRIKTAQNKIAAVFNNPTITGATNKRPQSAAQASPSPAGSKARPSSSRPKSKAEEESKQQQPSSFLISASSPKAAAAPSSSVSLALARPGGWNSYQPSDAYDPVDVGGAGADPLSPMPPRDSGASESMLASGSSALAGGASAAGGASGMFSSGFLSSGGGSVAVSASPSAGAVRRNRAPFRDPSAVGEGHEKSTSARMAHRIYTQLLFEEDPALASDPASSSASAAPLGVRKNMLKKFTVPRSIGAGSSSTPVLDRHSSLVQWNVMIWLMKDVFNERLRHARARFRAWIKAMRIFSMREELLQHSNTVRPLTREEKEKIARGEEVGTNNPKVASATAASSATASDSDDDTLDAPRRRLFTRVRSVASHSSRLSANSTSAFLSRTPTPAFFRLLLSEAEMAAIHRGVSLLLLHPDSRWLRDACVHSVHFIVLRPGLGRVGNASGGSMHAVIQPPVPHHVHQLPSPPVDLSQCIPLAIGHKQAARRIAQERLMSERARELHLETQAAAAAARAKAEAERQQREADELLVATLRPAAAATHRRAGSITLGSPTAATAGPHRRTPSRVLLPSAAEMAAAAAAAAGTPSAATAGSPSPSGSPLVARHRSALQGSPKVRSSSTGNTLSLPSPGHHSRGHSRGVSTGRSSGFHAPLANVGE